jgi:muramoyltetrapeptide carboxypeptidase LdcA involved in peptidoglycan recycling
MGSEIQSKSLWDKSRKKIAVIAPANSMMDLSMRSREAGVAQLSKLGFEIQFGTHIDKRYYHTAGTVEERLADFTNAILDPTVDLVMPVFGGYNSNQLLKHLDYDMIQKSGKSIIGYSDIDALLLAIKKKAGNACYHGPSFATFCDPNIFDYTISYFRQALASTTIECQPPEFTASDAWYLHPTPRPRELHPLGGWKVYTEGKSSAPITGGNLETITALAGTPFFPDTHGKILFIEDTSGNSPGAFHQRMTQLRDMGVLDSISGFLLGKMKQRSKLSDPELIHAILNDTLPSSKAYPVITDFTCSHVDPILTIPLEARVTLDTSKKSMLTIHGVN